MAEESGEKQAKRQFIVHTIGGEKIPISAYDMMPNEHENRLEFLDENGQIIKRWIVVLSAVAAIEITDPPTMSVGRLRR